MSSSRSARILAGILLTTGTLHFARPKVFDSIVPRKLPGSPRGWTYVSGAAELACGAAVAHSRTRKTGALASAALFVAVFPGNVKMAVDWKNKPRIPRYVAYARVPMQIPLIQWALRVYSKADD